MADQRNFRSAYLGKVGIKGVEEKTSIDLLLSEQPYDIEKLKQFCIRFPVPIRHRVVIWKLILDIVPPYQQTHEFVMQQRTEQYKDLKNAVYALGKGPENMSPPMLFLFMFHIQQGTLPFDEQRMLNEESSAVFMNMTNSVFELVEDHQTVDAYWITHKFFLLQQKYSAEKQILGNRVEHYLVKEDGENSKLHSHLTSLNAWKKIPFQKWINSCFAGLLPGNSFERVWDKLLGGTCKILVFVAVAMLLTSKDTVMRMKNSEDVASAITKIDEARAEGIVSRALELLQKHGAVS